MYSYHPSHILHFTVCFIIVILCKGESKRPSIGWVITSLIFVTILGAGKELLDHCDGNPKSVFSVCDIYANYFGWYIGMILSMLFEGR